MNIQAGGRTTRKVTPTATSSATGQDVSNLLVVKENPGTEQDALVIVDHTSAALSENAKQVEFVNDGPLAWMQSYLDLGGIKEGKSVYMGPFGVDVDASNRVTESQASAFRQQAACDLRNIGPDERARRDKAGDVMTALSAAYVVWAALIADDGSIIGHLLRFMAAVPIFFAIGYKVSAQKGLCNIAQSGMWDVDGNGLSKIEDPELASAILNKVNNMNLENLVKVVIPVAAFALLPQSRSMSLVLFSAIFAALYFMRDVDLPVSDADS